MWRKGSRASGSERWTSITGTGIDKALNDVDVLRRLVPAWLKTPGMETDKIEPSIAITKEVELTFVFGYTPEEFAGTLRNLAEGVIDVSGLVTAKVGLEGVAGAFVALGDPEAQVKVLVEPGL